MAAAAMKITAQILLVIALVACPLSAQDIAAPSGMALPQSLINAELANATVRVVYDAGTDPLVRTYLRQEEVPPEELLTGGHSADGFLLRLQEVEEGGQRPEIHLYLRPDQPLRFEGDRVEIEIGTSRSNASVGQEGRAGSKLLERPRTRTVPGGALGLEVGLRDSTAVLTGVTPERLVAVGSSIDLTDTQGSLLFEAEDSHSVLRNHQGPLNLRVTRGDISLDGSNGAVNGSLQGADLTGDGLRGRVKLELVDATVRLDRALAEVRIEGLRSQVEITDAVLKELSVGGEDLDCRLNRTEAPFSLNLAGSRLEGAELSGSMTLKLERDSDATLDVAAGAMEIFVASGSALRLSASYSRVVAEINDGSLFEVGGVDQLDLVAEEARIVARDVRRIQRLEMTASEMDMDLSLTEKFPALQLRGGSTAEIVLSAPCHVMASGPGVNLGDGTDVQGCSLDVSSAPRRKRLPPGLDGRPAQQLTVELTPGSDLRVRAAR